MKESTPLIIETRGLTKTYKGVQALRSLDLQVRQHSILGFLGPNGAGKTTTIKLLLGLIRPSGGGGTVFGCDIARQSIEIRRRVGYLAQQPHYYEHMTAREVLRFRARFFYRGPRPAIEARVAETLELVGLADKADRPIRTFSGGELQRLGLGQAQVNHPDLLILDEPAANLDPMGRRDVLEVMERLREHTTIFYSTHLLDDVQRVSDAVAILNHGELVAQAPIEELLVGSAGPIYSLVLQGDPNPAYARVIGQPWVTGIQVGRRNGYITWAVSVSNEEAARAELLRLVLAEQCLDVLEFGPKKYALEEVFMQIVEGGTHVER